MTDRRPDGARTRPRVLVVEDEAMLRRAFERALRRAFDVILTPDGAAAMDLLEADSDFDVVLTDVAMPRASGTDLYRHIRSRWPRLARRVLFVSGAVLEASDRELIERERLRVLDKPLDFEALRAAIHEAAGDGFPEPGRA